MQVPELEIEIEKIAEDLAEGITEAISIVLEIAEEEIKMFREKRKILQKIEQIITRSVTISCKMWYLEDTCLDDLDLGLIRRVAERLAGGNKTRIRQESFRSIKITHTRGRKGNTHQRSLCSGAGKRDVNMRS